MLLACRHTSKRDGPSEAAGCCQQNISRRHHIVSALASAGQMTSGRDFSLKRLRVLSIVQTRTGSRRDPHDFAGQKIIDTVWPASSFPHSIRPSEHRDLWPFRRGERPSAGWRHGFRDWFNHQGFHGIAAGRDGDARRTCARRSRRKISSRPREDADPQRQADYPAGSRDLHVRSAAASRWNIKHQRQSLCELHG
jgi:hypothetical protein